ncbi:MAG: hypothetical protein JSS81_24965 [Acidobacteria bacterium]|nr:hypothetical protein [Acidobacteriota bacterium]
MKLKRRTEIVLETRETTVIRFHRRVFVFCRSCRKKTLHLSTAQASRVLSLPVRTIERLAASGRIHATAADDGRPRFCADSLVAVDET